MTKNTSEVLISDVFSYFYLPIHIFFTLLLSPTHPFGSVPYCDRYFCLYTKIQPMQELKFTLLLIGFMGFSIVSQATCPGCVVSLPAGMAEDTLFLSAAPDGMIGQEYDEDISFRMPKTTTPVNQTDPSIPPDLAINSINIIGLSNVPPGLSWEANQSSYDPQEETDGCIKFCGTPLAPGWYTVDVTVEATVIIVTQEVTFPVEIYIAPSSSVSEGFNMINSSGCGEVTVSFENNVPSNGQSGFSYLWNFGNGNTSLNEQPTPQTYTEPGEYVVEYEAVIDTSGYILTSVNLTECDCNDIPTFPDFSNAPDMHVEIRNPAGNLVFNSDTYWNTNPPLEVATNITLTPGNYEVRFVDEDSGINGPDDICAMTIFTLLSDGTITGADFSLDLSIFHPTTTVESSDTVYVYAIPDAPIINAPLEITCAETEITLSSSYNENNQWFFNGEIIEGATAADLVVAEAGAYSVQYVSTEGCLALSEETIITVQDNLEVPEYFNSNNLLSLSGGITYSPDVAFQWYLNGVALEGENGTFYCINEDGEYTLEVTDQLTNCVSEFTLAQIYDDATSCTLGAETLAESFALELFPNPVQSQLQVKLETTVEVDLQLNLYDLLGRSYPLANAPRSVFGATTVSVDMESLPRGIYLLEMLIGTERLTRRVVKE